jgi:threonyl-tRNA synthetase
MSELRIAVQVDGDERAVGTGTTAGDLLDQAEDKARAVVAARVNGVLRDLSHVVEEGDKVEPVTVDSDAGRMIMRHSTAHVLAQAVQDLFPEAKLGIGPPIENGFYYDFDVTQPFRPEDLDRIEQRMRQIVKEGQRFARRVVSDDEARAELKDEPYKLEIIDQRSRASDEEAVEVGDGPLTIYDNLDPKTGDRRWRDLCRGPHVPSTRAIPAFKLLRSAGAYWRGSEKNPQLQRIYGTAWESKDALAQHLNLLKEVEKRDHRRLGVELDLFSFPDEIGSGLAVFHPKGSTVRRVMEEYSRRRHEEAGYLFVNSPHVTKEALFQESGHLGWYAENMYPPMEGDGTRYYVKPMNCPFHILIYRSRGRSYRELPMPLFEFGTVYRYEKSGVLHGLTMDDAHIFCTPEQLEGELRKLLRFVLDLLADFGLSDFYLELSTRDDEKDKFVGSEEDWADATEALRRAMDAEGLDYVPDEGGAAFYGPKISVQGRDAIGRTWQLSTIQVDFQLPQRFKLEYQASDGTRQRPIMVHRALFGSIERFFGILVEHYAGAFPAWLAPVQVAAIPISADQVPYLEELAERLRAEGVRVELYDSDDRMQRKIREAQRAKVPFMVLAGEKDVAQHSVSFRYRNGSQRNFVPVDEAVRHVVDYIESRDNTDPPGQPVTDEPPSRVAANPSG